MDVISGTPRDRSRLRLKIGKLEDEWREMHDNWDDKGNIQSVEDDLIPLIITTHAAIEDLTTHLILAFVIEDRVADGAFNYIYEGMSQSHREELLASCNILSNETRGKISEFKGLRNKVAHGTFERLDWYRDDIPERMNTAFEVLDLFEDAFTDADLIDDLYEGDETI